RVPPKIKHDVLPKVCEIPTVISSCPTGAIRPKTVDGKNSVEVIEEQCMYCGNCYTVCPAMPMADPENDGLSIWVGGKVSNARSAPTFSKLAIPFLPNNPPRWPEVVEAVSKIVEVYAKNARKHERVGEWIERIGWPRFLQLTGFEFTRYHIDDFKHAGETRQGRRERGRTQNHVAALAGNRRRKRCSDVGHHGQDSQSADQAGHGDHSPGLGHAQAGAAGHSGQPGKAGLQPHPGRVGRRLGPHRETRSGREGNHRTGGEGAEELPALRAAASS